MGDCKHDLACLECGESIGEIAKAADHAPLVTTVRVERYGGVHEGVTVWLRGANVGTLTVGKGDGEALRALLLSEGIVARARTLVQHWKDQDGFNASVVDDLMSEIDLLDSTALAEHRSEAASMSGCEHEGGDPGAPAREPTAEERALFRALIDYTPLGTAPSAPFLGSAIRGYTLRKHVDECHPGDVEKGAECAPKEGPEREGWLFGYRFVERKEGA